MAQCLSSFQHRHYLDIQQNSQLTVKMGIGEDAAEGPTKNQPRHACGIIDTGPKHVCVSMMHRDTRKEVPRLAQAGVLAQREGGILAQIRGPRCITRCTLRTPCGPCRSPSAASSRSAACCPTRAWRERGEESSLVSLRINNLRKTSVSESTAGVARLRLVSDPSSRLLELPMVVGWPPLYRSPRVDTACADGTPPSYVANKYQRQARALANDNKCREIRTGTDSGPNTRCSAAMA